MYYGLLVGLVFGFVLKRSRLCFTGGFRDMYLEKKKTVFYSFLVIIFIQSVLYFVMTNAQILPPNEHSPFSMVGVPIGSFIFGLGAIMASGCITTSLIKVGDGRLTGLIALLSFSFAATSAKQGIISKAIQPISDVGQVKDTFFTSLPFSELVIVVPCLLFSLWLMMRDKKKKPKAAFTLPSQYTGWRHVFFEKIWSVQTAAIIIGLLAAFGWWSSTKSGRHGGFGLTTPIISWVNWLVSGAIEINWGSFFVVGIVLGSFVCTFGSKEFHLTGSNGKALVSSFFGGAFMGIGSVMASGCIVGNAMVGTATLSIKAWLSFLFILLGIWLGAYIYYVRPNKDKI